MRTVFMGTPEFSAAILEELVEAVDVVAVYTRPDAVRGRGKKLTASPVKQFAESKGLPVYTPRTLRDAEVQSELRNLEPDVICVAAYGAILPKEVLDIPKFGCLNVHASLLPRWRGAAPIERAILAGDEEVGICIMRMEEGLDTGSFCISRSIPVAGRGAEALTGELADLGVRALITALVHIEAGQEHWTDQDESKATYADKIEKGELDLNPTLTCLENMRHVQASSSAHSSRCFIGEKGVSVLRADIPSQDNISDPVKSLQPGQAIFHGKRLFLCCADGALEVLDIKPDGKRAMSARDFAAGIPDLRMSGVTWHR